MSHTSYQLLHSAIQKLAIHVKAVNSYSGVVTNGRRERNCTSKAVRV